MHVSTNSSSTKKRLFVLGLLADSRRLSQEVKELERQRAFDVTDRDKQINDLAKQIDELQSR